MYTELLSSSYCWFDLDQLQRISHSKVDRRVCHLMGIQPTPLFFSRAYLILVDCCIRCYDSISQGIDVDRLFALLLQSDVAEHAHAISEMIEEEVHFHLYRQLSVPIAPSQ